MMTFADDNKMNSMGLMRSCKFDLFLYSINLINQTIKRTILSAIANICNPCTLLVKMLMQKLWADKLSVQLHSFTDTWEKVYGACIYLLSKSGNGNLHIELLCAKSKVASLKTITISKLELSAML